MAWYEYLFIVLAGLIILDAICIVLLYVALQKAFGHRYDGNPNLKYFTYRDFPELKTEEFSFTSNRGQTLVGLIYQSKETIDNGRMILFFHGIGAGHEAYTKEIRLLVKLTKMPVIAFDYTGCGRSFGHKIIGLTQPLIDADYLMRYLAKMPSFKDKQYIVIGHSWGAYVANNITTLKPKITLVRRVTMSGFIHPVLEIADQMHLPILRPFLAQLSMLMFGRYHFYRGDHSLKKSQIDSLIIHGKLDSVVPFSHHAQWLLKAVTKYPHLSLIACDKKKHNPYLTPKAEEGLLEVLRKDIQFIKQGNTESDEAKAFYQAIDYDYIGENDLEVFKRITHFMTHGGHSDDGKTNC